MANGGWVPNGGTSTSMDSYFDFESFANNFLENLFNQISIESNEIVDRTMNGGAFSDNDSGGYWDNDTASLADSITVYEYLPQKFGGFDNSEYKIGLAMAMRGWETARREGSSRYKQNMPEHYYPEYFEESFSNPTIVVSTGVGYPSMVGEDSELFGVVRDKLLDIAYEVADSFSR